MPRVNCVVDVLLLGVSTRMPKAYLHRPHHAYAFSDDDRMLIVAPMAGYPDDLAHMHYLWAVGHGDLEALFDEGRAWTHIDDALLELH
ncbi:MAG: hypothetical protein D6698_07380 [Gammaproteobacteria bacterium]|nr:MAG: hypothetical protein D6698_07380 [Gammaproteobacteria bacterium]